MAFAGPAVRIAMMEDEFVRRRGWLTREDFLELVGGSQIQIEDPDGNPIELHQR